MEKIRRKYTDDINASLFCAIGIAGGSGKEGLEHRREALAILLPIFMHNPIIPVLPTTSSMQQIPPNLRQKLYRPPANTQK
jgi:hypothetical protein